MTALISKTDLENELQITFDAGYTDAIFLEICAWAESRLKRKTNRTAFTGEATADAKMACVYLAIDRLTTSNPALISVAISSISEGGASISFSNGKDLKTYKKDAQEIIADLKLPGTPDFEHTYPAGGNTGIFLEE